MFSDDSESPNILKSQKPSGLQILDLSHNRLRSLDDPFGVVLKHLRILDASSNRLDHLPKSFRFLVHLKKLFMNGNLLKGIPDEITEIPFLEEMNFKDNLLETVNHQVVFMTNEKNSYFMFDPSVQIV